MLCTIDCRYRDGVTDIAIIRSGEIIEKAAIRTPCGRLRDSIQNTVMDRFNVSLYPREAERLVRNVGTACPGVFRIPLKVKGIDCATGCETTASINAQELSEAMAPIKDKILEVIKNVLHDLPPQDRM